MNGTFGRWTTEFVPATNLLLTDTSGHIWARRYLMPDVEVAEWLVFDPDGVWLGVVEVPADLSVLQIGADFVVGRMTDDLDIERVVQLGIERTPDGGS